jgi:DNA-binding IclR family transcriptional regulator
VSRDCGLPPGEAAAALTRLELAGLISCDSAGRYRRTTRAVAGIA